jgi:hypothetical protein
MTRFVMIPILFLTLAATLSSKDKVQKVTFDQMAIGMRDAFNCGVVVEQYLHGRLKGNDGAYHKERGTYNCDHVEEILNTLHDMDNAAQKPEQ